jgi:hypothetical protein
MKKGKDPEPDPDPQHWLRVQFDVAEIGNACHCGKLCVQVAVISSLSPDIVSFQSPVWCSRDRDCRLHRHALPSGSKNIKSLSKHSQL